MRLFLLTVGLLVLFSCTKDDFGRSYSVIANNSAHRILLTPYRSGVADSNLVRGLAPGDSAYVYQTSSADRSVAATWLEFIQRYDSIRIAYVDTTAGVTDTVRIGHIRSGVTAAYPRQVAPGNPRSIFGTAAWPEEIIEDSKYFLKARFTYTFTEADYLAAR